MKTKEEIEIQIRNLRNRKNSATIFDTNLDKLDGVLEGLEWVIGS